MNESPSSAMMSDDVAPGAPSVAAVSAQISSGAPAIWPLSPAQAGMWSEYQLSRGLPIYNMYSAVRLLGRLDVHALRASIQAVVTRHDTLRTRITLVGGQPMQAVDPHHEVGLPVCDLSSCTQASREQALTQRIEAAARHEFDLERGPLFRCELVRLGEGEHVLLSNLHHVIADGWSNMVLVREVAALYDARVRGQDAPLPRLTIQYGRHCERLRERPRNREMSRQLEFWEQRLSDLEPTLPLCARSRRPAAKTYEAQTQSCDVPASLLGALKALAQAQKCSLFMLLLAAFKVLVSRYAARTDIAVATPTANRSDPELADLIGLFANTLILRTDLAGVATFARALQRVKEGCAIAFRHQEVPFHDIVEAAKPVRGASQLPFTQIFFVLHNVPEQSRVMGDLRLESLHLERRLSAYDLQVELFRDADGLRVHFTYNRDLFDRDFARQITGHYIDVLRQVAAEPARRLEALVLGEPRLQARAATRATSVAGVRATFQTALREYARGPALVRSGQTVTYEELQRRAARLASDLSRSFSSRSIIGLYADDPVDLSVGLLAVLQSGHICLPALSAQDRAHARALASVLLGPNDALREILGAHEIQLLESGWYSGCTRNAADTAAQLVGTDAVVVFDAAGEPVALSEHTIAMEADALLSQLSLPPQGTLLQVGHLGAASTVRNLLLSWRVGGCVRFEASHTSPLADADLVCIDAHSAAQWLAQDEPGVSVAVLCTDGPLSALAPTSIATRTSRIFYSPGLPELYGTSAPQRVCVSQSSGSPCIALQIPQGAVVLTKLMHPAPRGTRGRLFQQAPRDGIWRLSGGRSQPTIALDGSLLAETGVYGVCDDGAILIEHDDASSWTWRDAQRVRLAAIERELRALERVKDCVVRARRHSTGESFLVAYLAHAATVSVESLIERAARGSRSAWPESFVSVASIPLCSDGSIDEAALRALPIIDAALLKECEERGRAIDEALDAAALVEPPAVVARTLHWTDLCPPGITLPGIEVASAAPAVRRHEALSGSTARAHSIGPAPSGQTQAPCVLPELLVAASRDEHKGIVYLDDDATERSENYRAVLDQASRIRCGLARSGMKPGDIAIFQLADNRDFLHAFWACELGGYVPVPLELVPGYSKAGAKRDKLLNVWELLGRPRVISDRAGAVRMRAIELPAGATIEALALQTLRDNPPQGEPHVPKPDDLALLLLTSGSTGTPKAVMQTHRALIARCLSTAGALALEERDVSFNWMPMDHVGGLVMFHLMDVFLRARQVHATTAGVLADPLRWIEWMSRYRATITWAPNFAYALLNERLAKGVPPGIDLSAMRCMINAGEAVVAATCRRFLSLLAPHGLAPDALRPAWGMSETCSALTCNRAFTIASTGDADSFVSNGQPFPACELRIVDAQDRVIAQSSVGRIQVRGPMVTHGYYRNPAATLAAFTADGWFKTGDLGYLAGGELYITGREKDTIIVNGTNYYPQEIEALVERVESVQVASAAACALRRGGSQTDELAVFFSPSESRAKPTAKLIADVRNAIVEQVGLSPACVVPLPLDQIPKTSIGKIQRSALVRRLEAGEFDAVLKRLDLELKTANTVPERYFARQWRPSAIRDRDDTRRLRAVLIFDDALGLGAALSRHLGERFAAPVVLVSAAKAFCRRSETRYAIDPQSEEDYFRLLSGLRADAIAVDEVLHLWTSAGARRLSDLAALRTAQQTGVLSVLRLVQSLQRVHGEHEPMRLRVVSTLAQGLTGDREIAVAHGALFGLLSTVNLETPWLDASHIDLDEAPLEAGVDHIIAEIARSGSDAEVAYRRGVRMTPVLRRIDITANRSDSPALVRGGTYLVVGGLGGIGVHVVDMLLSQFDARVIVVGRSELPLEEKSGGPDRTGKSDARARAHARLRARAPERMAYESVDIRDPIALEQAVAKWESRWAQPLAGIFQLATQGTVEEQWREAEMHRVASQTARSFEEAISVKVYGTWNLCQLLRSRPRATLITFSSVNGLFGGNLLGAYSAASGFQDRLNRAMRIAEGIDCYCLLWTLWQDLGMSQNMPEFATRASRALGYGTLSIQAGLWSLLAALRKAPGEWIVGLDAASTTLRSRIAVKTSSPQITLYVACDGATAAQMPQQLAVRDTTGTPVTAKVIRVAQIPRRPDGTPDHEVLRARTGADARDGSGEPGNETQRQLWRIWRDVLGKDSFGVRDNFFDLGGDSILAIQVVARANRLGWRLSTRSMFEHQTIAALAAIAREPGPPQLVRDPYVGEVPLAPVQLWFLDRQFRRPNHWNQSVLLELRGGLDERAARAALDALLAHHDMLRLRIHWGAQPRAAIDASVGCVPFERIEVRERPAAASSMLQAEATRVQGSLDLERGPLLRAAWFDCGTHESGYLLLAVHHMAIDGVSWRILIESFLGAYEQALRGEQIKLPPRTAHYADWSRALRDLARSRELKSDAQYWLDMPRDGYADLGGSLSNAGSVATEAIESFDLRREDTAALLQHQASVGDVLLASLLLAFRECRGARRLLLTMEGHGREGVIDDMDLSLTVGWFTSIYPLALEVAADATPLHVLAEVKRQVQRVPKRGFSFGVMRYLSDDRALRALLESLPTPRVSLNYLGQFDGSLAGQSRFAFADVPAGRMQDVSEKRVHELEIVAYVVDGVMRFNWSYDSSAGVEATVKSLARSFREALTGPLEQSSRSGAPIPADFPLVTIGEVQLREILECAARQGARIEQIWPATPAQLGLLFHTLRDPDSGVYVSQLMNEIRGELDVPGLRAAWQAALSRNETYRTCFYGLDSATPLQIVLEAARLPWAMLDWCDVPVQEQERRFGQLLLEDRRRGFDATSSPLMRVTLVRLAPDRHRLILTEHHAITDGWSRALILKDVFDCYGAIAQGRQPSLPARPSYAGYVRWFREQSVGDAESYWRKLLQGLRTPTPLFGDRPPPSGSDCADSHHVTRRLDRQMVQRLRRVAREHGVTLNTLLQGAWAVLLGHYADQPEVLFGATDSGRSPSLSGVHEMTGLFISNVPVRVQVDGERELGTWLRELQAQQLASSEHAYVSMREIQSWSEIAAPQALFDSVVVVENYPSAEASSARGVTLAWADSVDQSHFPLMLVIEAKKEVAVRAYFDRLRVRGADVARMLEHYEVVLRSITDEGTVRLRDLRVLTEPETRMLASLNATEKSFDSYKCMQEALTQRATDRPEATAVIAADRTLSYGELFRESLALATSLRRAGAARNELVAVAIEKGWEQVVAVYGVLYAGAAYLPVDPKWPLERQRQVIEASGAKMVVIAGLSEPPGGAQGLPALRVAAGPGESRECAILPPPSYQSPDDAAYVIFTSGSTGTPKGVTIRHSAAMNTLLDINERFGVSRADRVLGLSSLTFDLSVYDIFGIVAAGGTLVLPSPEQEKDPAAWAALIERHGVTICDTVPGMMQMLVDHLDESPPRAGDALPRLILMSGDWIPLQLPGRIRSHSPGSRIVSLGGATEASIWSISYEIGAIDPGWSSVPYGLPLANQSFHVLNGHLQPCPVGIAGDLYIGGIGLADGYWRDPPRTAQQFIVHPASGERLYRTGDRGRVHANGYIEFLGRVDSQVKVHGYRVDLTEIENALAGQPSVKQAVVGVKASGGGGSQLIAYVVPEEAGEIDHASLRQQLAARLPQYMVPWQYVAIEKVPLTSNGKVDRSRLPDVVTERPGATARASSSVTEEVLAAIWADVLKTPQITPADNFFERGGHSLMVTQVIARIRKTFAVDLPIRSLFDAPTIRQLASRIQQARACATQLHEPLKAVAASCVEASSSQKRSWLVEHLHEGTTTLNIAIRLLLDGRLDICALERSVGELVRRHASLRTTFVEENGVLMQAVAGEPVAQLQTIEMPEAQALEDSVREARRAFDLERGPLLRVTLYRLAPQRHLLLAAFHHIICDGWSLAIFMDELVSLYEALVRDAAPSLPPLSVQYQDFSQWQREWLRGAECERQIAYWRDALAGVPATSTFPSNRARVRQPTGIGADVPFDIEPALAEAVALLSRREAVTAYIVYLAALTVLLAEQAEQGDLAIGVTIANRHFAQVEGVIGFFANQVVVRSHIDEQQPFTDFLAATRATVLAAYDHQDVPFERVVEAVGRAGSLAHTPLFQVKLVLQNAPVPIRDAAGLQVQPLDVDLGASKFDLQITMEERAQGLHAVATYSVDLYEGTYVRSLVADFKCLLCEGASDATLTVAELMNRMRAARRERLRPVATAVRAAVPIGAARAPRPTVSERP